MKTEPDLIPLLEADFYYCTVEWTEAENSYLGMYWTWAFHFGEAINAVEDCAKKDGYENPKATFIDFFDFDELPEDAIVIDDKTYMDKEIYSYPTEDVYKLPVGVIFAPGEHSFDESQIKPAYEIGHHEDGTIEIEAVVEATEIMPIYVELVSILPEIRVFWLKLADDWESADAEQLFVNEAVNSPAKVLEYIENNSFDTLQNGHVTITAYFDDGNTNINISFHKSIVVLTNDKDLAAKFTGILKKRGLRKKKQLISIANGFHHWHYRHHESLNRADLIEKLKTQGFKEWDG